MIRCRKNSDWAKDCHPLKQGIKAFPRKAVGNVFEW